VGISFISGPYHADLLWDPRHRLKLIQTSGLPRGILGLLIDFPDDLTGAPIFGLQWLLNSPRMSAHCIAEDGFSVYVPTIDLRSFVLHKIWISNRKDRDPLKATRDRDQAKYVAEIATKYLGLTFNDDDLRAIPAKLRSLIKE